MGLRRFGSDGHLPAGHLAGPRVVGLAAGGAEHLRHEVELPRHLVPSNVVTAVGVELRERRCHAVAGLDESGQALAPAIVGHTDDDGLEHPRVGPAGLLELLGEALLSLVAVALPNPPTQHYWAVALHTVHDTRTVFRTPLPH